MKIGVESNWGVGNFLFGMSLALSDICRNKRKNELFLLEAKRGWFDHKRNKIREISDDIFSIFDPQIDLKIIYDQNVLADGIIYRGFDFKHDLSYCQTYIQNVLKFSDKANKLCEEFLSSVAFKNSNLKEFISINIRGGDFKSYYNNIDERLEISYYDSIIDTLPNHLPIIVSVVPQEEANEYKNKFKKYSNRLYFTNDYLEYPMCIPITAQSKYCCISNSTFHWWGGFLNKTGKIYYPNPWFKKFQQQMWFPRHWIPVTSIKEKKALASPIVYPNKSVKIKHSNKSSMSIKLSNKMHPTQRVILNVEGSGKAHVSGHLDMTWRPVGKNRMSLFHTKNKSKIGEIIKNPTTGEYLVVLDVFGKTSSTAWIGKEI